jgi:hypothetical protein
MGFEGTKGRVWRCGAGRFWLRVGHQIWIDGLYVHHRLEMDKEHRHEQGYYTQAEVLLFPVTIAMKLAAVVRFIASFQLLSRSKAQNSLSLSTLLYLDVLS